MLFSAVLLLAVLFANALWQQDKFAISFWVDPQVPNVVFACYFI